jgi:lipopolysaccharide/colanic/teichoic acid biosynthesis glycosyltransferase
VYLSGIDRLRVEESVSKRFADAFPNEAGRLRIDVCRVLDVVFSLGALIFVLPLMLATAAAIKVQDGGPILFGHMRIGQGGRAFRCWKFRSMVVDAEARLAAVLARDPRARAEWEADHKLRRDPRVTALGRFIRLTSIDELPQLLNVLRGEMSLVGPRPIVPDEARRYGRWFRHYCAVRPGVTGIWQVSGRNDVDYRRRVAMDVLLAKTVTPKRYLVILLATVPAVARRSGSY